MDVECLQESAFAWHLGAGTESAGRRWITNSCGVTVFEDAWCELGNSGHACVPGNLSVGR